MAGLLIIELFGRIPLEVDIIRDRNSLYRETNEGLIENVYTLKILNKSQIGKPDFITKTDSRSLPSMTRDAQYVPPVSGRPIDAIFSGGLVVFH